LIRATRWIGGTGMHRINRIAPIHHANPERTSPGDPGRGPAIVVIRGWAGLHPVPDSGSYAPPLP
jgi:hypothetical protein